MLRFSDIFDTGPDIPRCARCDGSDTFRNGDIWICARCGNYWPVRVTRITATGHTDYIVRNPEEEGSDG